MKLKIKLTEVSVLGGDRKPVTIFPDHIGMIKAHEDGGSWILISGNATRVAETEDEILDKWRAAR